MGCCDTFYDRLKGFTLCFFLLLQDNTFVVKMLQLATEQRVSDRRHAELRSDSQTFFWRQRRLEAELISLAELTVSGLGTSSVVKKSKKDRRKPKWPRLVNLIRLRSLLPPEQLCLWENVWITVTPSGGSDALMDGWEQKWGAWRYGAGRGVVVVGWMFGTHLQGPHQSVCWLRPKRARHFLGEPGSEHNAQHAQNKKEEKREKKKRKKKNKEERKRRKKRGLEEERQRKTERKRHKSSSGQEKPPTGLFVQRKAIRSNC